MKRCFKEVQRSFKEVSRVFKECLMSDSRKFQKPFQAGYKKDFKRTSMKFQVFFIKLLSVFQECFKEVKRQVQLEVPHSEIQVELD